MPPHLASAQRSRPGFPSCGVGTGPHQSPIRIKAVARRIASGLCPWPPWRPQKTVGALHVSKSFDMFADDRFMVARHDGGGHPPRLARGRGEQVKPVAFSKPVFLRSLLLRQGRAALFAARRSAPLTPDGDLGGCQGEKPRTSALPPDRPCRPSVWRRGGRWPNQV